MAAWRREPGTAAGDARRAAAIAAVGPDALLLKFSERQGGLRAADLRFLSCYPAEAEHVWPPMTHLQPTGNMEVVRLPALGDAKFTVVEVEPQIEPRRRYCASDSCGEGGGGGEEEVAAAVCAAERAPAADGRRRAASPR